MRLRNEIVALRSKIRNPKSEIVRRGFTLVELLVVVAILTTLLALLTGTVFKALGQVKHVETISEIHQLGNQLEQFKLTYGEYPPSQIKLSERGNYPQKDTPGTLDSFSVNYLQRIFTNIVLTEGHDWNGNLSIENSPGGDFILEGDECLVYFLGGVPYRDPSTGLIDLGGFSSDKAHPTKPQNRTRSLYEFKPERLVVDFRAGDPTYEYSFPNLRHPTTGRALQPFIRNNRFAVYLDPYKFPYAYLAARPPGQDNNYYGMIDCPSLMQPVKDQDGNTVNSAFEAYWQNERVISTSPPVSNRRYHKPDSFQIISAGKDRIFGGGSGRYDPRDPSTLHLLARDNLSNFAGGRFEAGR